MEKLGDFLFYKDLRRLDEFKTKYKLFLLFCIAFMFITLNILFGFNTGAIGAGFYALIAGYLGKGLFFLIVKLFGKTQDLCYSEKYLQKINKSK